MNATAADGLALLRAILDDPADDLPRLALADLLEEQEGYSARVQMIRLGVANPQWDDHWTATHPCKASVMTPVGLVEIPLGMNWKLHRGFVEAVRCPLAAWQAHGPAIVQAHPVTALSLTDRTPWYSEDSPGYGETGAYRWLRAMQNTPHCLDDEGKLWDWIHGVKGVEGCAFDSEREAFAALIDWANWEVGRWPKR